eukprot:178158_1
MANNKDEEMRLKFLQMAKKFNWNLSSISNRQPNQHNLNNSTPQNNLPITEITCPPNTTPTNPLPTPFNFSNINKQNPISNTQNINNSIIDSEATLSEDDIFPFNSNNQHPIINKNSNTNTNQLNPHIPFTFSTPIKNFDQIQRKKHDSFIKQHMTSASKSILESPIPHNKNTQNTNKINPLPNTNENKNISINNNNISFCTHNSNEKHSNNSKCSSLELTEENLSKHNQSFHEHNKSKSNTESISSALSKHHTFVLLEVSSSESETNISENKQIKNNIGKTNEEVNGIQHKLSFLDLTQCSNENNNSLLYNTPLITRNINSNNKRKYFTNYTQTTKENATSMFSKFLDLCSSEDDESDIQVPAVTPIPFIDDKNDLIPELPITNNINMTPLISDKNNIIYKKKRFNTAHITKKRKKIMMDKKRDNILQTVKVNKYSKSNPKILCNETLSVKEFKKQKDEYTLWFLNKLNQNAFDNKLKLNDNLTFAWCKTLNKTAGDCRLITRGGMRKAHIRLATKVLDTLQKLKQTLCHEMCHAMAWIVHANRKPPHGSHFKFWANKAELAFNDIRVTTCHSYKIQYKFQWKCIKCQYSYGRHSKSIKEDVHRCGICSGKLEFVGRLKPDGSYVKPKKKAPSKFTIFMKEHMAAIKRQYPGAKHGDVMRILSEKYKQSKQNDAKTMI